MHDKLVFVDANIIIEIIEQRKNHAAAVKLVRENPSKLCISVLTCHIVMYVCSRKIDPEVILNFLKDFVIIDSTHEDVLWAEQRRLSNDFEDALQIAAAIRSGCNQFVTFDKELAKKYSDLPTIKMKLLRA